MMKNWWVKITILVLVLVAIISTAILYRQKEPKLDPNSPSTYYKIFNYKEFMNPSEDDTTKEVLTKLDNRLEKYQAEFSAITKTNDKQKQKALFYMNFVQMYGYYFERDLPERKTFRHLLWNTDANNCASNTLILAMLLDRAGYEYRTVSINDLSHGFVEVKFSDGWQILDPTTNLWFKASTEEILSGKSPEIERFFLKADDQSNTLARKHLERGYDVAKLRDNMLELGKTFPAKIDRYNYFDFSDWDY